MVKVYTVKLTKTNFYGRILAEREIAIALLFMTLMMKKYLCRLSQLRGISVYVNPMFLFMNTMGDNFNCADVLVRLLAIDCYYGKNKNGFDIYNEMQMKRVLKNPNVPNDRAYNQERFIELIKSFENNKFDDNYPIQINKEVEVLDGVHRLALSLYHHIDRVPVYFSESRLDRKVDYSLEWFKSEDMEKYIPDIIKKYEELMAESKEEYIVLFNVNDSEYMNIKKRLLNNKNIRVKSCLFLDDKDITKFGDINIKNNDGKIYGFYIECDYKIRPLDIINEKSCVIYEEFSDVNSDYIVVTSDEDINKILKLGEECNE